MNETFITVLMYRKCLEFYSNTEMALVGKRQNVEPHMDIAIEILKLPTHVLKFPSTLIKSLLLFHSEH